MLLNICHNMLKALGIRKSNTLLGPIRIVYIEEE